MTLLRRLVPYPRLAAAILAMWLLLAGVSPTSALLGSFVAVAATHTLHVLGIEAPRMRLGWPAVKLLGLVLADILRSNIAVARIVLCNPRRRHAGFIELPTTLRNPYALSLLAIIITSTPGTIWVHHDARRQVIIIHVLDLIDEAAWIDLLRNRYEKLLQEMFP